jgi:Serine-pyruvate aminotransferase/archaeal aspartate aminotransferase
MKLFTLGPVEMYERTLQVGGRQDQYNRLPEFSSVMQETDGLLKEFLNAPQGYYSIYLSSSGTGGIESTIINCFTPQDKMLIVNGGTFGMYFVNICTIHKIPFDTIDIPFGETFTEDYLKPFEGKDYTALLVNIHETSVGQLYDKQMLADFCKRNNLYFIVDAISSVGMDELDITKYGIDATIISANKGLALSSGIAIVVLSERLYEEKIKDSETKSFYFDFKSYITNFERFQTPFTPAIGILQQLNDRLKMIAENGGAAKMVEETRLKAEYFRSKVVEIPLELASFPFSNACTPINLEEGLSAITIHKKLKDEYGLMIHSTPPARERYFKVGHFGDLQISDYNQLLCALEKVVKELRAKL